MKKVKNISEQILETYKKHLDKGLNIGAEGNISVRVNDEKIYITPSGINISELDQTQISVIDIKGCLKNKIQPSSETDLHLSLYKSSKNINSVVHCHSQWASTLSCLRKDIPPFHYMIAEFGGKDVKCAKYATFGTRKLAQNVLRVIKNRKGCLLSNHGQICVGNSLDEASHLSFALEKLSKQYFFCLLSNKNVILTDEEINEVIELFPGYKSKH